MNPSTNYKAGSPGGSLRLYTAWGMLTGLLAFLLRWSMVVSLTAMLLLVGYQVFMRYVIGSPPSWAEELAVLMFSWSATGAFALGVREGFHVRMIAYRALPDPLQKLWERLTFVLIGAFGLFLAWAGWRFVELTAGGRSAGARYPIEILHIMAPISGALIFLFAVDGVISGKEGEPRRLLGGEPEK